MGLIEETFKTRYEPPIFIKYTEIFDYKSLNNYHTLHPVDIEETYKFLFRALEESTSFVFINICGDVYYIKDNYGEINDENYELVLDPNSKAFKRYKMEYKMEKE